MLLFWSLYIALLVLHLNNIPQNSMTILFFIMYMPNVSLYMMRLSVVVFVYFYVICLCGENITRTLGVISILCHCLLHWSVTTIKFPLTLM